MFAVSLVAVEVRSLDFGFPGQDRHFTAKTEMAMKSGGCVFGGVCKCGVVEVEVDRSFLRF